MYKQNMEDLESNLTVVQTILREQANTLKGLFVAWHELWTGKGESSFSLRVLVPCCVSLHPANGMWNEELESQYSMGCELCDSQQGRLLRSQIDGEWPTSVLYSYLVVF